MSEPFGVESPFDLMPGLGAAGAPDGWGAVEAPTPTADDVRAEIAMMTAADQFPTLTDAQLSQLVTRCRRADASNLSVADPQWSPTYDIAWAVWRGWQMKAAACAGSSDFTADGNSYSVSQVFAHCLTMADQYRRKVGGTMVMYAPRRSGTVEPNVSNLPSVGVPWAS